MTTDAEPRGAEMGRLREENAKLQGYLHAVRQDLLAIEDTAARPCVVSLARSVGASIDGWLEEGNAARNDDQKRGERAARPSLGRDTDLDRLAG